MFSVSALLDGLWLERAAGTTDYDVEAMLDTCAHLIDASITFASEDRSAARLAPRAAAV